MDSIQNVSFFTHRAILQCNIFYIIDADFFHFFFFYDIIIWFSWQTINDIKLKVFKLLIIYRGSSLNHIFFHIKM